MDLIFKRYSSPFLLIDNLIMHCKLSSFIRELSEIRREEDVWEYYLHKINDKSYIDFKNSLDLDSELVEEQDFETTIKESIDILNSFELKEV